MGLNPASVKSVGMYVVGCRLHGAVVSQAISRDCEDMTWLSSTSNSPAKNASEHMKSFKALVI